MMTPEEEELLIEAVASAHRDHGADGVASHPSWHDLEAPARARAFEVARVMRELEAAMDPAGVSATGRSVLARIRGGR